MELLHDFRKKGYFTSTLYHLLVHKKIMPTDTEIIPSTYLKEMKTSTQDRLQKLNNMDISNLICNSDPDMKPVLEFIPKIIVFQNVKPNEKVVAKFSVRNISKTPTFINMVFKESSSFFVKPCSSSLLSRLAPGISVSFSVTYIVQRAQDSVHRVVFTTDKQQYAIPLIGMGPRPIFDFPDEIIVPPTPLKVENSSLLTVKNLSTMVASYTIYTKCPFAVKPKFCHNMRPDDLAESKVTFKSMHYGQSVGKLVVTCETDEMFIIKVSGTTYTVSIELEKAVVRFLDTYNTMIRQQTFKITNKSDQIISYICMKNESIFNDFEDKIKLATIFYDVKDSEVAKYQKLVQYEVLSSDEHERVYTRIFFDEIQSLVADESLYFNDQHFSIMPIKGKLWPKEATSITITFCPKEIGDLVAVAFLDIDGITERVPLTMQGTSLPPNIHLHIEHLDMDNVYINKTYRYEIVAINKGHINGVIQHKEITPLFGSVISCTPEKYCLRPGDKEVFIVSFLNSNQGPYFEELNFTIQDTDIVRKLYLKGTVIYPTMTFSVPCLDFGNVNVGVPKTLQVDVINESEVTVTAILKISSDGPEVSSITLKDCEACEDKNLILALPQWPKEFNIEPTKIIMTANSRITLRVTLTPNLVRTNQTVLELELEKSDSPPITLPISFNSQVPVIIPAPDIKLRACFLDFTYYYDVVITANEFYGYFVIEEPNEKNTLKVNVEIKRGMIEPNSTLSLPVSIMTGVLGPQEYTVQMGLFGLPQPIDICHISVLGVRPIVTCNPISLHWGHLKLLTRSYKTLTLANDSPVTVYFKSGILNNDGKWSIKPEEGHIEPEGETDLTLSLCLVDADTYTNKVVIHLEKVKDIFVPLTVVGVGTSIVVGKDHDHVDLGRHFIKFPLEVRVPIKNCGTRLHSLEWSEHYKAPKIKELPPPFFNIEPRCLKISSTETSELKITGYSAKVGFIKETWYLIGSVEGINKKELLMECEITGEFVEPKVILSTTEINLQYDFGPYSEYYKLTDIVTIKNVSKLPLHLDISIKPPFAIVQRDTYKIEDVDTDMCCCITYDAEDPALQKILEEAGHQEPHKFLDCITKKPIKRQRQGPLHFFQDIHKIKAVFEFTHTIDEKLEDQEIMKLQIVFDTTKHLNLKSKVYGDVMRVKFRGHKNKDAVRIIGKINFPNVIVFTPKVEFQCILNGSIESKVIKINNPTALMVCYKFQWRKWNLRKVEVPELQIMDVVSETKIEEDIPTIVAESKDLIQTSEIAPEQEKNMLEGRDSLVPSLKEESTIEDSQMEFQLMKSKFLRKVTPMLCMEKYCEFQWAYKFNRKIKENSEIEINEILNLVPHYGMLAPGETQYIQVMFRPPMNISVRALLECQVLGGPSEFITISGQSSDLIYKLNTHTINFKIRSCHELASENLIITNLAKFVFEYRTYLNEPEYENKLFAKICEIVPPNKVVDAEEETEVAIVINPGVHGYFKRRFLLEIGHLPHIPIEVFGWGVIPQIYLNLPRPGLFKLNVEIGYKAISTMSLEYLAAVSEILSSGTTTAHLNSPQTEKCFEDPDFQEDWHICSAWDGYPTVMDIEMAIERYLVIRYVKFRPDLMNMCTTATKVVPIPGFHTIPYLLDFGVIITGNSVSCSIDVTNYGPVPVKMYFHKSYMSRSFLNIKLCGKLNSGEVSKLEVTFTPDSHDFPELEQNLDMTANLEVPYGVSIPLNVIALCAVPFLKSNITTLDLGSVRCGDKIIASVPLANVGKPTCIWYVTLKIKSPGANSMSILDSSGMYEPGESGWLTLSFKPTMEMLYQAVLVFRFHMNPTKMEIPVIGQGIFPHPHIIGPDVKFPPTLPWAETTEIYFGITNPCPFPIELIIAHVDQKWKGEEELYHLLYRYYNKPEEMLLPSLKPGFGMPTEITEFYVNFKTNVQRGIEEEAIAAAKLASTKGTTVKKVKSPKGKSSGKEKEKVDKETSPARKIRTEAEIISDHIKVMKEEGLDPLKACLASMEDPPLEIDKYANGLLLFLHGSPYEEIYCKEMAYTLGMNLGIPTVNFDSCFVEALLLCNCNAKTIIMSALNDNLELLRKCATKGTVDSDDNDYEDPYSFGEHLDEIEIITKKLEFLSTNKNIGTPRSKTSDKKKKDVSEVTSQVIGNANIMFQMELLLELLTEYFAQDRFQRGFVMDSLTSTVIKVPTVLLTTVLKCKRTIYNIHLVLCQSDFYKWAQAYEETIREAELAEERQNQVKVFNELEIEVIVNSFQEMDYEEYENADPELKAIYIKHGLEERKRKRLEKLTPAGTDITLKKEKGIKEQSIILQSDPSDVKKKAKKEDAKGWKPTAEYFAAQSKYNDYQRNVYDILIQISNNWIIEECEIGIPLYTFTGAILGAAQKKSKKVKSDIHLNNVLDSGITEEEPPRGFPLTIIMCPCLQYKAALVEMFNCPFIQKKLSAPEKPNTLLLPVKRKEYTVLLPKYMPQIHHEEPLSWRFLDELPIKKCECNQITDLNLLDDTTQDNVLNILSKWHCVCGKKTKMASSQTSTTGLLGTDNSPLLKVDEEQEIDPYFYPMPLRSVRSITAPEGRLVLEPGDLVRCKYAFNPQYEGNFTIKRYVEVAGWPDSRVDINITGICDLPRLDNRPKKMFANFVRRTQEDQVYKLTYLDDQKKFEFGPIFIGINRIYEEEYSIELKNASLLTANVDIEFMDYDPVFLINKNFISLEPGCRDQVTVTAAPVRVGDQATYLLFCIKDNPEIVKIDISCSGVVPILEVLPLTKLIDYGKLLLYRREDDRFIIKNDSILPIMWKVKNPEDFLEDFILSRTSGIIPRHENHVIPITYIACNVGIITQLPMTIEIYDELGRGDPMVVDYLWFSAECYDVMVECAFENPNENFLNFGNVKVNSPVYRDMFLLNRGKYNIYYKLKKVKNFPEPALLKLFDCVPDCGVIPPNLRLVAIEFQCTPNTSINLNNVPAYTCSLLDGSKDQVVVAKFPVGVTIASFYNTFTLFPLGELNFHIIAVGSGVMREVILNNTSKCPFNYEIVVPAEYRVEIPQELPSNMKKETKLKNPPIKCGNFLIVNEDNLLAPGDSRTIQIQFLATAARTFEETIHFIVSDTCPAEASGVPLRLVGTGAIPALDFWNLENTFREHLIVKNMQEYKVPESSPHCVFVEDSVTLHFFCVTVNTRHTGAIDLYNNGVVPCILTMKMIYQGNTSEDIFSLSKNEMQIDALMHKRLGITFAPKELQEYRAVLTVKLKLLHNQEQTFQLCLIGEGVIPRIRLIKPPIRQHRLALLTFPVTCLGSTTHKSLKFKNITTINSTVSLQVFQAPAERPVFWLTPSEKCKLINTKEESEYVLIELILKPNEVATIKVSFSPLIKGRTNCDVKIKIFHNPYEHYTIMCEAEAFVEDVILIGLEMLSMDYDIEAMRLEGIVPGVTEPGRKKSKSAPTDKQKSYKEMKSKFAMGAGEMTDPAVLKYLLDFGGCELCTAHKRSVVMLNNSEKVYRFVWDQLENILIKPAVGYISPGEEKDIEIAFLSALPVAIKRELLTCNFVAISDEYLSLDSKGATWDNRQVQTVFELNPETGQSERMETLLKEPRPGNTDVLGVVTIIILYSVTTEYTKYLSDLREESKLRDTYIYQKRSFKFKVENVGVVPMKLSWNFFIEEGYPRKIDRRRQRSTNEAIPEGGPEQLSMDESNTIVDDKSLVPSNKEEGSKETLFSESMDRYSVDTCLDTDIPFTIEPKKVCLNPLESQTFLVTFSPLDAFDFTIRLRSSIDNLDPYDQNLSCKIKARSLVPYVHLDLEENDYLWSGRRKNITGIVLPPHMQVLEFNVLGSGCYKKTFQVINPTSEAYEFTFISLLPEFTDRDFIPVHCNVLKGYVEGGTSTPVTFTFTPTAPGVYESQWKFRIEQHDLTIPLMVVGFVREPDVVFVPTIMIIKNSLVGFTTTQEVKLKNNENEPLNFEFKGDSLVNESGNTIIVVRPNTGTLKPNSETKITIHYTPVQDGPLSFKIFCQIAYMTKYMTLCVNALSHLIKPTVTYYLIGNEHVLDYDVVTNIHLEQTASTYERQIPFKIKNDGSTTFTFEWNYVVATVKKYLNVSVEPRTGYVAPASELECVLHFHLKTVPVQAYPVTLTISDGPLYQIYLFAEIEKPLYHFSCKEYDFGKCIINAPHRTYKKNLAFTNDDTVPVTLDIATESTAELYLDYRLDPEIYPKQRAKIPVYFRPNAVQHYEFKIQFWVNSLCEENIVIRGEGVPLLVDLYEGCQRSFDLGPVKVGDKIVREIDVMNHSKVPIDCNFVFKEVYPNLEKRDDDKESLGTSICLDPNSPALHGDAQQAGPSRTRCVKAYYDELQQEQIEKDIKNALASVKVVPNKAVIQPHRKIPLKIHFKPVGLISELNLQLDVVVLGTSRPLVLLSGSATGMSLHFSQNSLQFGRVRKRGCKVLKVMLYNKGDFGTNFCWQPLVSDEFKISPMRGVIAARTNVTFTITFRPNNYNPFVKVWAICNLENYKNLELSLYAACVDVGVPQNQSIYIECPVREVKTEYVIITNPTDENWLVLSEFSAETPSFETLREFYIDANIVFDIPIHFKPKTAGKHEAQVLYSPLGESALYVTLIGVALHPNPNGVIDLTLEAKKSHTEVLTVFNITENPECYIVTTELMKVVPDKFDGYYEIKYPDSVRVWGEAKGTCLWTFICFEPCEMFLKVMFVHEITREYQFYEINVKVEPSKIVGTLKFTCRARECVQQELTVNNPLAEDSDFQIVSEKLLCAETIRIARNSETQLTMTYSPLVVGEFEDTLTITNYLMGTYTYRVVAVCKPAKEKSVEVSTTLGTMIPVRLRIQNKSNLNSTFIASATHPSTILERHYELQPFEKGKFLIWFEPTDLGVQNSRVVFDSDTAGQFVFNIKGVGLDPKPQGPFEVKSNGYASIKFKNVFEDTRTFRVFVDREDFFVRQAMEQIKPKKEIRVQVYLSERPARGWAEAPTGCLTIENFEPAEPKVQWTYFLQGIP